MRYSRLGLIILILLVVSTPLFAQEDTLTHVGLGISIDPTSTGELAYVRSTLRGTQLVPLTNFPAIVFYVPINFKNRFRLEPSFGLFSLKSSTSSTNVSSGYYSTQTSTNDATIATIGIRATYCSLLSNSLAVYVGPRVELGFVSLTDEYSYLNTYSGTTTSSDDKTTTSETDVTFGAVVGAEYFPVQKFSIGGEVGLNYILFGNPDVLQEHTPPQSPSSTSSSRSQHVLFTNTLFFVRWYFL